MILYREGYSKRKLSAKCNVSKIAAHTAIVNWGLRGSCTDLKRSGRPKKTTVRDDHLMKRRVVRSPTSSIKKVQSALVAKGVKVSDLTVSRQLTYDFGSKSRKPAKKPLLTKFGKAKHLAFAKAHEYWTTEHWSKILFSDESTIQQFAVRKQNVFGQKKTDTMRSTQFQLRNIPLPLVK